MDFSEILSHREFLFHHLKKRFQKARTEDIEDAVQNALIKAVRFHDKWNGDCSLKTWLAIIAVNMYTDSFRRPYKKNESLLETEENMYLFEEVSTDDFSIKLCDTDQFDSFLNDLFADFDGNVHIEAFKLHAIEEIDYKDIAIEQNIPLGTVKSRVFRARKLLSKRYNEICHKYFTDAV